MNVGVATKYVEDAANYPERPESAQRIFEFSISQTSRRLCDSAIKKMEGLKQSKILFVPAGETILSAFEGVFQPLLRTTSVERPIDAPDMDETPAESGKDARPIEIAVFR